MKTSTYIQLLLIFLFLINMHPKAQSNWEYEWINQTTQRHLDNQIQDIHVDNENNVYAFINFKDTLQIEDTTYVLPYKEYMLHAAIAKYSQDGNFIKAFTIEAAPHPNNYLYDIKMTTDAENNLYISGDFIMRIFLLDTVINHGSWPYTESIETFVAKISPEMELIWAKTITGMQSDRCIGLCSAGNDMFLATLHSGGGSNMCVAEYFGVDTVTYDHAFISLLNFNQNGELLWRKEINCRGDHISLYDLGLFDGQILSISGSTFYDIMVEEDIIPYPDPNSSKRRTFFIEFDKNGYFMNGKITKWMIYPKCWLPDSNNNIYFSGTVYDTMVMGQDTITNHDDSTTVILGKLTHDYMPVWFEVNKKHWNYDLKPYNILLTDESLLITNTFYKHFNYSHHSFYFGEYPEVFIGRVNAGTGDLMDYFQTNSTLGVWDNATKFDLCGNLVIAGAFQSRGYFGNDTLFSHHYSLQDGLLAKIRRFPKPQLDLLHDTTIKIRDTLVLHVPDDYLSYRWSTGDSTNSISIPAADLGPGESYIWLDVLCYLRDSASINIIDDTGLEEYNESKMQVYPNPAREHFVVGSSLFVEGNCTIQLFDLYGRKAKEIRVPKGKEQIIVDVESQVAGLYLLRLRSDTGQTESVKVVVE